MRQLITASRRMTTLPNRSIPTTELLPECQRQLWQSCTALYERRAFSSVAVKFDEEYCDNEQQQHRDKGFTVNKPCTTCNCESESAIVNADHGATARHLSLDMVEKTSTSLFPCGSNYHEDELDSLPDPLPDPKYSVHKRVLPKDLTAFNSKEGKRLLMEALFVDETAESYWNLTAHFINQGDPAFCGVTTLIMCLNALCVDPNVRWRGGWRYYGSEEVLLGRCCLSIERIKRSGITLEDFCQLGRCQGLRIELKRPTAITNDEGDDGKRGNSDHTNGYSLGEFRDDALRILSDKVRRPLLVVAFSRQALGQTGDGHFSTIAAYHKGTDQVLVLDVARFKYAPYWVSVRDLYRSMQELDSVTKKPRGWFVLYPPKNHACQHVTKEDRRPLEVVPIVGGKDICPVGDIRKQFCKSNPHAVSD